MSPTSPRQRVAVVTGGAGGIGGSIAEALGREGWYVVTVDPLVTLDGSEHLAETEDSTAARIVAAGGSARASNASVTDAKAVRALFEELAAEHGGLDAVVNVAGITRQSYFARGTEEDWVVLLNVHLAGYLNVLEAALPLMASAGHGRILGVTSGSGWRAADAGGYSAAKRAVAALTWQLGRAAPAGVTINAISPIANTRMVQAALERARAEGRAGGGGGLSLDAIPGPENLGPLAAYLVSDEAGWCSGQVFFAGGPEVAVVDQPRLVEVVRTDSVASLASVLESAVHRAFVTAEEHQATQGGANPRFGSIFDEPPPGDLSVAGDVRSCVIVSERRDLTPALVSALEARSITCLKADPARNFHDAARALRAAIDATAKPATAVGESLATPPQPIDAVVVALAGNPAGPDASSAWEAVLDDRRGLIAHLQADAAWSRAVADYAAESERHVRLVTLTDATTPTGRSRAQVAAQIARVAAGATGGRVTSLAASLESTSADAAEPTAELVGHLLAHPGNAAALAGSELVVGTGWIGLRTHPRPIGTVVYGGPAIPAWMDGALREIVGASGATSPAGVEGR
jgi:NAD(P)-dependent dehydrogenase (short-subunit alcohol dehydrogenase family)